MRISNYIDSLPRSYLHFSKHEMIIDCPLVLLWWNAQGLNSVSSEETQINVIYSTAETLISYCWYLRGKPPWEAPKLPPILSDTDCGYIVTKGKKWHRHLCWVIVRALNFKICMDRCSNARSLAIGAFIMIHIPNLNSRNTSCQYFLVMIVE